MKNEQDDWRMNEMKKISALFLALAMCVGLMAGCSSTGDTPNSDQPASSPSTSTQTDVQTSTQPSENTELSGTVNLNGSTSVEKPILAMAEAFMEMYPDVSVNYDPTGSSTGINAVLEGTCDVGLASRDLKDEESSQGLTATVFALDGIAIIVNSENPVADLTLDQIAALATGEITNWSEVVDGYDAPVVLIGREAGSGTRDGFESITGTEDTCVYTQELTSTGAVIQAVAGNPNAFGYASLSAVESADGVKAVSVEGVAPSEATVLDGTYKVQRNFNFVFNSSSELSEAAQAFVDFALSADAADLIAGAGAVPLA